MITTIARRVGKTPTQVALAAAGVTAFLPASTRRGRSGEDFEISALRENAMRELRRGITTNVRFNAAVQTGVPDFVPRAR